MSPFRRHGHRIHGVTRHRWGTPVMLFPTHLGGAGISLTGYQSRPLYAVTRDGRFLMNVNADSAAADIPPLTVVLNWQEALKQRVPTR